MEITNCDVQSGSGSGHPPPPYAFTELGVAMLSSVLNSDRAIQMNILIMRAFVKLRALLATHKELAARIERLEAGHRDHAIAISLVAKDLESLTSRVKDATAPQAAPNWLLSGRKLAWRFCSR